MLIVWFIFTVSPKKLETVCAACEVLLKYILNTLHVARTELNLSTNEIEQYINAIRVLCIGKGSLNSTEFSSLLETMKGENLPQQSILTGNRLLKCIYS